MQRNGTTYGVRARQTSLQHSTAVSGKTGPGIYQVRVRSLCTQTDGTKRLRYLTQTFRLKPSYLLRLRPITPQNAMGDSRQSDQSRLATAAFDLAAAHHFFGLQYAHTLHHIQMVENAKLRLIVRRNTLREETQDPWNDVNRFELVAHLTDLIGSCDEALRALRATAEIFARTMELQ